MKKTILCTPIADSWVIVTISNGDSIFILYVFLCIYVHIRLEKTPENGIIEGKKITS